LQSAFITDQDVEGLFSLYATAGAASLTRDQIVSALSYLSLDGSKVTVAEASLSDFKRLVHAALDEQRAL
jgi:hypothetical protein